MWFKIIWVQTFLTAVQLEVDKEEEEEDIEDVAKRAKGRKQGGGPFSGTALKDR